jgi:two-component system chemotaxis response regulator CheB
MKVRRMAPCRASSPSRAALADAIEEGGCQVIGRAMDGAMALRMVLEHDPDVITCDLEMPRMDGFTFLRILGKTKATPVIVVTSDARPEAALQALELGARDFVVKPAKGPAEMRTLGNQLVARIRALTQARQNPPSATTAWAPPSSDVSVPSECGLVVIGTSTGGPRALRDILGRFPARFRVPVLVAQHMPKHFTTAFAERLARSTGIDVSEARDGEVALPSTVRIAPGGRHLRVVPVGERYVLRTSTSQTSDRYVPSVDLLLQSAAEAAGPRLLALVLTGMGKDGAEGARVCRAAGAAMWTESPLTAAIDGMPAAAAAAHGNAVRLPLDELASLLARVVE